MKTVIEMAKEAGLFTHKEVQPEIGRFAELVRADEREEIKQVVEKELLNNSALMSMPPKSSAAWNILMAIRARSEK